MPKLSSMEKKIHVQELVNAHIASANKHLEQLSRHNNVAHLMIDYVKGLENIHDYLTSLSTLDLKNKQFCLFFFEYFNKMDAINCSPHSFVTKLGSGIVRANHNHAFEVFEQNFLDLFSFLENDYWEKPSYIILLASGVIVLALFITACCFLPIATVIAIGVGCILAYPFLTLILSLPLIALAHTYIIYRENNTLFLEENMFLTDIMNIIHAGGTSATVESQHLQPENGEQRKKCWLNHFGFWIAANKIHNVLEKTPSPPSENTKSARHI